MLIFRLSTTVSIMMNNLNFAWYVYLGLVLVSVIAEVVCETHVHDKTDFLPKLQESSNSGRCLEEHNAKGQLVVSCVGLDWDYLDSELRMETAILKIDCEESSLNMSFISELNKIKELNLMSCTLVHLNTGLRRLTELQNFVLSDGGMTDIGLVTKSLSSLFKLRYLSLSTNSGITTVRRDDFTPLKSTSLEFLDLSGCQIDNIHRDAFIDIPQLRSFDFSQNPINEVSLRNLTIAIKSRKIERLCLRSLSGLKGFPTAALRELMNTTIEELDVSDNDFSDVPEKGFYHPFLRNLKLVNSKITSINYKAFYQTTQLETIDLRENRFTSLENQLSWSVKLRVVDLSKHDSVLSENRKFKIFEGSLDNLYSLEKLALNEVPIRETIKKYMFRGLKSLRELQLSFGKIENIEDFAFASLIKLINLDLSSNEMKEVRKEMFHNLTNLKTLNLEGNNIQYFANGDNSKISPFENLKQLKVLNLKRNKISSISNEIFYGLDQLRSLRIQENGLLTWNVQSLNMGRRVKGLHFGHNRIFSITEAMLNDFSKFPELETLDLSYNPFDCSTCDIAKFHDWWEKRNTSLHLHSDSSAYICDSPMKIKGKTIFNLRSTYDKCLPPETIMTSKVMTSTSSSSTEGNNWKRFSGNFHSTFGMIGITLIGVLITLTSVVFTLKFCYNAKRYRDQRQTQLNSDRDCEGIVIEKPTRH